MTPEERMDQLYATVEYDEVRPWREIDELATSEDEPEDEDPVPSKKKAKHLSGTTEGAIKGWETRRGGVPEKAPGLSAFGRRLILLEGNTEGAIKGWETRRAGGAVTGKDVQTHVTPDLAAKAQEVYDKWDESDVDCYGGGGICHLIAEEMAGALQEQGIEAATVSQSIGEQHVYVVAKLKDGVYAIDVPPSTYETGGGYTWKKKQDVQITKADVVVDKIDGDPEKFEDYIEMAADRGAAIHLYGTSEGAILGWETRRRGGTKWDTEREDDWRQKDGRFWQRTGTKNDGGKLTVTGITLPPEIAMQVLGDRDPSEVVSSIFSQVDGDVEVELTKGIVFKGKPAVTMLLKRADGLKIQRTLVMTDKGLIAEHDSFEVPEGIQGAGLAKKVMADSYDTYKEMGVKRVELHANLSVGGYAWAKYGMKATNPRKAAERFDAELRKRDGSWEPRQQGAMRALIEKYRNDPKLPWHLAGLVTKDGRQIGKELMLGSAWGATLDMNDEEATNRLKHYVMSKG